MPTPEETRLALIEEIKEEPLWRTGDLITADKTNLTLRFIKNLVNNPAMQCFETTIQPVSDPTVTVLNNYITPGFYNLAANAVPSGAPTGTWRKQGGFLRIEAAATDFKRVLQTLITRTTPPLVYLRYGEANDNTVTWSDWSRLAFFDEINQKYNTVQEFTKTT